MNISNILLVGLGSCLGGAARYVLSKAIQEHAVGAFPWGTFAVNLLGCLIIGFIFGLLDRGFTLSNELKLFLTVGFCGGFTTFSTFMNENYLLLGHSNFGIFLLYAAISFIGGLILVYLGYFFARFVIS